MSCCNLIKHYFLRNKIILTSKAIFVIAHFIFSVTTKGSPPPAIPTEAPAPRNPKFSNGVRCNFDSSSLCGFTQDKTDRADFRFHQGATLSRRTGPSSDHTTGRGIVLKAMMTSQKS